MSGYLGAKLLFHYDIGDTYILGTYNNVEKGLQVNASYLNRISTKQLTKKDYASSGPALH
ncbi:hypothetical protein GDO78_013478 [Eleutherodactylus coqui]|uniref:Uncharacterized protein n=1 Tax=Eleutherodactylus coqui TaxID=57060 RepID=A0A8J6F0P1_ELECQ|nr:hypothetical protein GDO78_013478 [Eleutherodactylus coqui]